MPTNYVHYTARNIIYNLRQRFSHYDLEDGQQAVPWPLQKRDLLRFRCDLICCNDSFVWSRWRCELRDVNPDRGRHRQASAMTCHFDPRNLEGKLTTTPQLNGINIQKCPNTTSSSSLVSIDLALTMHDYRR
jgi:hypothetical protein